ncbi:two-component sensor histidine kinase [Alishewanella longhuensis]|uniref:histidine kinase n=1 Tax=Alishewanella longhuensis TaxID=1091037 RepID=A0ABQ3L6I8_9ALTE|nr:ATP-binding protein [Alishewanella longhuensis]GHG68397.1 two-component sensor histidine kinase [Alishewanella longhuensis]
MKVIPLKLRQGLVSAVLLLLLLPSSFVAIEQAFYRQLLTNAEQKMEVHMYAILSELHLTDGKIELNNNTLAPDFYRPDSGLSAFVTDGQRLLWQSDSSLNQEFQVPEIQLTPGQHIFYELEQAETEYQILSIAFLFDSGDSAQPLAIHVVQSHEMLMAPHKSFRSTLLRWFTGIAAGLLLLSILAYYWTTKPLTRLDHEIRQLERGKQDHLTGNYPSELNVIKEDLNLLLASQNRQKLRYRNHLSDLAHALKTPVAVLRTSPLAQQPELKEQIDRITAMIEHQLKKASSSGQDIWKKQTPLLPLAEKLINALRKIYRDKGCVIELACAEQAFFRGDETDIMEILGNLLDNACKACNKKVLVKVEQHPFTLIVEDDGPGIAPNKRQELFERGTRLDTYVDGHGVGLSIVAELVNSYSGTISIADSELGGARFTLIFADEN